jgi:hypothetical protein
MAVMNFVLCFNTSFDETSQQKFYVKGDWSFRYRSEYVAAVRTCLWDVSYILLLNFVESLCNRGVEKTTEWGA